MLSAYLGYFLMISASTDQVTILLITLFLVLIQYFVFKVYRRFNNWPWSEKSQGNKIRLLMPQVLQDASHTLHFLLDSEKFLKKLLSMVNDVVTPLNFPGRPVYLAMPGKQVLFLFRNSRYLLPFPSVFDALSTLFGLPREDFHIFSTATTSLADSGGHRNDPSRTIMMNQRKDMMLYLQGNNLNSLMQRFTSKLVKVMRDESEHFRHDLYHYMTRRLFLAEVAVIYGESIFETCPTICEDFWSFYEAIPVISRKLPVWMSPRSYASRRKLLNNCRRWQLSCASGSHEGKDAVDTTGTDPVWGTQYIRRMYERFRDLGFSEGGIASSMMGFLFLTVANSIPASVWMMLYIFLDDDLRERVELEISDAFEGDKGVVQIDKLLKAPLLNSICNEVLRLRVGSLVGRTSESTLELSGGSKLQPGIPVMSANWLGGLDTKFWNTGRVMPDNTTEHPLDRFWAERFLEYHDDVASGPLHKDHLHGEEPPLTQAAGVGPVRCARVVTNGLQSHWFPFGGGAYRCPGEALAKQTMLVSVAVVLKELHIELQNPGIAAATGSKHRTLPFGSHAFDRVVPFRIRVRDAE